MMCLFSVVIKLRVEERGFLPVSHGRLLHAAFLNCIRELDADLSQKLHDAESKRFSLGLLNFKVAPQKGNHIFRHGDTAYWRIGCIGDDLLQVVGKLQRGYCFKIGTNSFRVLDVAFAGNQQVVSFAQLYAAGQSLAAAKRLTLEFTTAATFRYYNFDYPFPKPELVFGSLAEKWNKYASENTFDVEKIKQIAADYLLPDNWRGETKRIDFGKNRAVTGFTGKFSYRLELLPEEFRAIFIALAQFAYYAGVGRLNGQGCGQVNIVLIK